MPAGEAPSSPHARPTVFLSYASEDRDAAKAIRDALPALGLEVWYDESALDGGDAWDQKIRRQIRECDLFMPLISAQTESRHEGYFRREWRLAVERTLDMADDHIFLVPVVIDDTVETGARVPDRFLSVQWTRLPGGKPSPVFEALCKRLASGQVSGQSAGLQSPRRSRDPAAKLWMRGVPPTYPEFPKAEPGQKSGFYGRVALWLAQSAWVTFKRVPRFIRIIGTLWLCVTLLSRGCSSSSDDHPKRLSAADTQKLKQIADTYKSGGDKADIGKLVGSIARTFPDETGDAQTAANPLIAIPFSVPPGDTAAQKVADATFAQVYGRVSISHHGRVGAANDPLPTADLAAAVARAQALHATYVLYGSIDAPSPSQSLTLKLVNVPKGSEMWSGSYPVAGADPATIAAEVNSKVPTLEED